MVPADVTTTAHERRRRRRLRFRRCDVTAGHRRQTGEQMDKRQWERSSLNLDAVTKPSFNVRAPALLLHRNVQNQNGCQTRSQAQRSSRASTTTRRKAEQTERKTKQKPPDATLWWNFISFLLLSDLLSQRPLSLAVQQWHHEWGLHQVKEITHFKCL